MHNPFGHLNSSPEVIRLAVMMYVRYPLSRLWCMAPGHGPRSPARVEIIEAQNGATCRCPLPTAAARAFSVNTTPAVELQIGSWRLCTRRPSHRSMIASQPTGDYQWPLAYVLGRERPHDGRVPEADRKSEAAAGVG